MKDLEIIDHTDEVKEAMEDAVLKALTAIGLEAEGDVKEKITEPKMHKWGDKLHPKMRGSVNHGVLSERVGDAIQREMLRVLDNEKASADLKVQASRILLQIGR